MTRNAVQKVRDEAKAVWDAAPELLQPINAHYGVDVAARIEDDGVWKALAVDAR
jgi:hypothetical protein